jgi:putative antitoxin of VapBC-like toxin-antitoxin system
MRDDLTMRTTLDIDDDVLQAAKELGEMKKKTAGKILSELARQALEPKRTYRVRNGVPILPHRPGAPLITSADVRRWLDEDE